MTNTKAGAATLEGHEALADKIIAALRGDDGQAEKARGLRDLNSLDLKSLTGLLETAFPGQGPGLAETDLRPAQTTQGIIADFAELDEAGVPAEVVTFLKDKTYLGKMTVLSRETVGPAGRRGPAAEGRPGHHLVAHRACSSTSPSASSWPTASRPSSP